jgi:hypothetical protein
MIRYCVLSWIWYEYICNKLAASDYSLATTNEFICFPWCLRQLFIQGPGGSMS